MKKLTLLFAIICLFTISCNVETTKVETVTDSTIVSVSHTSIVPNTADSVKVGEVIDSLKK